jgi:dolichol-phosphate mannosyltransferase
MRRFFWQFVLLDFNTVTVLLLGGLALLLFGFVFGMLRWWCSTISHVPANAGTAVRATLPFMLGFQCFLVALVMDILAESSRRDSAASHFPKPSNRT